MRGCDSICVGEWIFLFLWIISIPTYSMVIYTIWKHRKTKFKGEFWFLTMSLFIADVLHLCQHMWRRKASPWGLVPGILLRTTPKLVGWLMLVPHVALFSAQAIGVAFVSVNRYLAITKPGYHSLWTRKTTIKCICVQWATAILVLLIHIPVRFNLVWNSEDNNSTFTSMVEPASSSLASMSLGVLFGLGGLVRSILFVGLYTHMFYYVYKNERAVEPSRNHQQRSSGHPEFNLAAIGGMLALCDILITITAFQAAIEFKRAGGNVSAELIRRGAFQNACLMDVYGWMNAWLLLAFSKAVRTQFLKQYGCKKTTEVVTQNRRTRTNP